MRKKPSRRQLFKYHSRKPILRNPGENAGQRAGNKSSKKTEKNNSPSLLYNRSDWGWSEKEEKWLIV